MNSSIVDFLSQQNITWDGRQLLRNNSNTVTERAVIEALAKASGFSMDALTEAAKAKFASARKGASTEFVTMLNNYGAVSAPQQLDAVKLNKFLPARFREGFNDADRSIFADIFFSTNLDSLHMYCRKNEDSWEMAEIPLQLATDRAPATRISAVLAKCTRAGHGVAELMMAKHNALISEFNKVIKSTHENPNVAAWDALGIAAKDLFPVSYYTAGNIFVQFERRTEHFESAGNQQNANVAYLIRGFFSIRNQEMNDPIDILAENPGRLLRDPERVIDAPVPFTNDRAIKALHFLDLNAICTEGPHDRWDFYWKRFSAEEAEVYKAFIWSILKADSHGRQMLYIYDPQGYSGKSVVTNVITRFLGTDLVQNLQKDSLTNQFAFSKIYDKRLVVYSDNKNPSLARSEKFHLMTGGDSAEVERKGSSSFSYRMNLKLIANGNTALTIDTEALHERTRVIVLHPKVTNEILKEICVLGDDDEPQKTPEGSYKFIGDGKFEDQLFGEFSNMLSECKTAYEKLCPNDGDIILPDSMYDSIAEMESDENSIYNEILEEWFTMGENLTVSPAELGRVFSNAVSSLTPADSSPFHLEFNNFVEHLRKAVPNFRKIKPHRGGRVYAGLCPKNGKVLPTEFPPARKEDAVTNFDVSEML